MNRDKICLVNTGQYINNKEQSFSVKKAEKDTSTVGSIRVDAN